ncbi:hypothetical protein IMSHALPRED_006026 [Imshaugia aleurites]|uniref:SAP domain-containing protein n=1 Tax=Imshaugia aleurites TaxID=172621 RepID=A0A8H3FFV7_9LECA|nr:hypothetical protein IMSHALPRED_006026 [Imshaugia aleurites]
MATIATMGQVDMRSDLERRGLVVYGNNQDLRTRLERDETRGVFKGDFDTMSCVYLRESCQLLSIPSTGDRQSLIDNLKKYNVYKRQKMDDMEDEGEINAGLPQPEDRLGAPTAVRILGTRGSEIHCRPYAEYLAGYQRAKGTTQDAWTFRYWRTLRYPDASPDELWPCRYSDGRLNRFE